MSTENLIQALQDGDNVAAAKHFNSAMTQRVTDTLDAKKIEIASNLVDRVASKEEE